MWNSIWKQVYSSQWFAFNFYLRWIWIQIEIKLPSKVTLLYSRQFHPHYLQSHRRLITTVASPRRWTKSIGLLTGCHCKETSTLMPPLLLPWLPTPAHSVLARCPVLIVPMPKARKPCGQQLGTPQWPSPNRSPNQRTRLLRNVCQRLPNRSFDLLILSCCLVAYDMEMVEMVKPTYLKTYLYDILNYCPSPVFGISFSAFW